MTHNIILSSDVCRIGKTMFALAIVKILKTIIFRRESFGTAVEGTMRNVWNKNNIIIITRDNFLYLRLRPHVIYANEGGNARCASNRGARDNICLRTVAARRFSVASTSKRVISRPATYKWRANVCKRNYPFGKHSLFTLAKALHYNVSRATKRARVTRYNNVRAGTRHDVYPGRQRGPTNRSETLFFIRDITFGKLFRPSTCTQQY